MIKAVMTFTKGGQQQGRCSTPSKPNGKTVPLLLPQKMTHQCFLICIPIVSRVTSFASALSKQMTVTSAWLREDCSHGYKKTMWTVVERKPDANSSLLSQTHFPSTRPPSYRLFRLERQYRTILQTSNYVQCMDVLHELETPPSDLLPVKIVIKMLTGHPKLQTRYFMTLSILNV